MSSPTRGALSAFFSDFYRAVQDGAFRTATRRRTLTLSKIAVARRTGNIGPAHLRGPLERIAKNPPSACFLVVLLVRSYVRSISGRARSPAQSKGRSLDTPPRRHPPPTQRTLPSMSAVHRPSFFVATAPVTGDATTGHLPLCIGDVMRLSRPGPPGHPDCAVGCLWHSPTTGSSWSNEGLVPFDNKSPLPPVPVLISGTPKQSEKLLLHHVLGE